MGFYLRKAISVGPFRFNLSNGSVGVSVGVRGLRFGMSPRGNYVHMGRGGVYYRATIPSARSQQPPQSAPAVPPPESSPRVPPGTVGPMVEIESAAASSIVDSSSLELLQELHEKRRAGSLWPAVAIISGLFAAMALAGKWPLWFLALIVAAGSGLTLLARSRDVLRKTVVVFYEMEGELERAYQELHDAGAALAGCAGTWHVASQGAVHDRKYHAGASSVVARKTTRIAKSKPPYLQTNIETMSLCVGKQTLHFFPERVLIYEPSGVGAVSYRNLRAEVAPIRFIEDGSVPHDAKVVDRTWRYVNKKGGPDKRFKNNRELPVCQYDELRFTSATGLNELIQLSKTGAADRFAQALGRLAAVVPDDARMTSKS